MVLEEKENPEDEKIIIKPTNLKPDSWYRETCLIYGRDNELGDDELKELKEFDENYDLYNFMQKAWREKRLEYGRKYYQVYNKELGEYEKTYLKIGEFPPEPYLSTYNEMKYKGIELPSKFNQAWSDLQYYEDRDFFEEYNNLQDNKKYLDRSKKVITLFKKNNLIEDEKYLNLKFKQIKAYSKALNEGYLITSDLICLIELIEEDIYSLIGCIDEDCSLSNNSFNFEKLKNLLLNKDPSQIVFDDFQIKNEELYALLRKNEKWYDFNRDLSIYLERNKGKYIQELADQFNMKRTAVSMVIKKVSGALNYWKGKLFEDFIEMRLKSSRLFTKVVKDAGKGESDIRAYKEDKLYIYSLKNLKIDYSPYWLMAEEIRPELETALLCKLDYEVHLVLLIYDNYHKRTLQLEIDYNKLENINLTTNEWLD
ncbi:MAG: hypothetical protein ACTSRG_20245 [Candidatus Helarchaeota archaeon]